MKACQSNSATKTRHFFLLLCLEPVHERSWHQLQSVELPISQKMFFINIWEVVKGCKTSIWRIKGTTFMHSFL